VCVLIPRDRSRVSGGLEEATEMAGIQIEREKRFAMLPDSLSKVSYETLSINMKN
jgi:hypothetical protein